jgi:hypothetical protein
MSILKRETEVHSRIIAPLKVRKIGAIEFATHWAVQIGIFVKQPKAATRDQSNFLGGLAIVGKRPNQGDRPEEELANSDRRGIAMITFPGDDTGQEQQKDSNRR